ncbi:coiled-coil domain-containing protein 69 [Lepisosteus oculatus]|uniref:coiled-coil domain-containing protein 69 n=1 Tax=Lepisosteus oculatus TaxID=7918 RepID=UPI0035F51B07
MGAATSRGCCRGLRKKKRKNAAKEQVKLSKELNNLQDGCDQCLQKDAGLALEKLKEQHEWELESLRETLKGTWTSEREELLKAHQEAIERLVEEITAKIKTETSVELNASFDDKIKCITEEHTNKTEELQKLHSQEKKTLTDNFKETEASLQGKVDVLTAELQVFNELKQRVKESVLTRDLQRNIKDHGSPGSFWEQELNSLLFVIEMKNERIQNFSKKLLQMEALAEKNLSLEDRVKNLLQQNEDLRLRMEKHQTLIQELSREHARLQESLEKESLLSQRLNQEKEELLYRLVNGDSPPTFHVSPFTPELSPR